MLYLVPTPIGNLKDITLRALDVLKAVDIIYCEDKRHTQKLLNHYGISGKLEAYHEHNAEKVRPKIFKQLQEGKDLALLSDAGMPVISDPGYKLIQGCQDQDLDYTVLPGASSVLTALVASGFPPDRFIFAGFLPPKSGQRRRVLKDFQALNATRIFFESPHRVVGSLEDIYCVYGDCEVVVCRELSKLFEEVKRGPVQEVIEYYKGSPPRGEIVLLVKTNGHRIEVDVDEELKIALRDYKTKEAASIVAEKTGLSKKDLYERALKLQNER